MIMLKKIIILGFILISNYNFAQSYTEEDLKYGETIYSKSFTGPCNKGKINCVDSSGKRHGVWEDEDGLRKYQIPYKHGQVHGVMKEFYKGKLQRSIEYEDGIKQGVEKTYHDNGKVWTIDSWRNGIRHGLYVSYHENGRIVGVYYMVENKRDGFTILYDKKGKLKSEIYSEYGNKLWEKVYDKKGGLVQYISWSDYQKKRWEEYYDKNGNIIIKTIYDPNIYTINGGLKKIIFYNKDGSILKQAEFPKADKEFDIKTMKVKPCFNCRDKEENENDIDLLKILK